MKLTEDQRAELKKLIREVYEEGYYCGIDYSEWFDAYTLTVENILNGEKYTSDLVAANFTLIEREKKHD